MNDQNKHNTLERATFLFGVITVVALLAYLAFSYQQNDDTPPQIDIVTQVESRGQLYSYKIMVTNTGEETAENARLVFALYQNGQEVESAAVELTYIPVNSHKTAWITFYRQPKPNDSLVVRSASFVKP